MDDDDIDYIGLIQCLHWNLSVQWLIEINSVMTWMMMTLITLVRPNVYIGTFQYSG
jgi:hypothetical protein